MGRDVVSFPIWGKTLRFPDPLLRFYPLRDIPADTGHSIIPLVEDPFHLVLRGQSVAILVAAQINIQILCIFTGHSLLIEPLHHGE